MSAPEKLSEESEKISIKLNQIFVYGICLIFILSIVFFIILSF